MRCPIAFLGLLAVFAFTLPALAEDEKKSDKKETEKKDTEATPPAKPEPKPKMVTVGQIEGKVTGVELESKAVAIEVTMSWYEGQNRREHKQTHQLKLADDVQVFWRWLPIEYDDKGRPKKPNPKDVKKPVKGPGGISGYPTETENIRREQHVIAVLQQKKEAPKPAPKKKTDSTAEEIKPVVTAVYIVFEPKR